MSQSPNGSLEKEDAYRSGWQALNRLLRQGYSWSGNERNVAFLNTGGAAFADVSAVTGLNFRDDGRSAARVDWDLDGDEDLVLVNRTGPRLRLLKNQAPRRGGFLQLLLEGRDCNRDGIGARVEVRLAGRSDAAAPAVLVQTRRSSEGYLAQASAWMHFGLGDGQPAQVTVRWPDGSVDVHQELAAEACYRLVQGTAPERVTRLGAPAALQDGPLNAPPRAALTRIVLPEPVPLPRLQVESSDGRGGTLFGVGVRAARAQAGDRPLLLNLWASWCAPCAGELAGLAAASDALQAAGLDVLALSVDSEEARPAARQLLATVGWPFPAGFASPQAIETLDALQGALRDSERRLPLPTSLLVDARGQAVVLYLGPLDAEQVLRDLALLDASPADRRAAAVPFPGTWREAPLGATLAVLERSFQERALPEVALEYHPGSIHLEFGRARLEQDRAADAERHFRAALESGPDLQAAWAGLGYALQLQGRTAEAVGCYRGALGYAPDDPPVLYNLGLALLAEQRLDEAKDVVALLQRLGSGYAATLEARIREARRD